MVRLAPLSVDDFADAFDRTAERTICPRWTTRVAARLQSHALDRELIADVDPSSCPVLAARAAMLTSRRRRVAIADSLERALDGSRRSAGPVRTLPPRESVAAHSDDVRALVDLLHSRVPLYVRGIAMLEEMLRDGTGPLYAGEQVALGERLLEARSALTG